jgi:hypothetical protein
MKHTIWLANSRAGSGYPAQGIKMPSQDFFGILKMSLFHCSYIFIKQDSVIHALGMLLDFRKMQKNTLACGSGIFTFSESLATSLVHESCNRYCFINLTGPPLTEKPHLHMTASPNFSQSKHFLTFHYQPAVMSSNTILDFVLL